MTGVIAAATGAPEGIAPAPREGPRVTITQPDQTPPNTPPREDPAQDQPQPYVATHYTGHLPAAQGTVAKTLEATGDAAAQRTLASMLCEASCYLD